MSERVADPDYDARGFRVVDTVGQGTVREFAVEVAPDSPRFEGHFPGHPVLPAVSQLCDLIWPLAQRAWPDVGVVVAAPRIKFSRVIVPGDHLTLRLERVPARRQLRFELRHAEGACTVGTLELDR